MPAPRCFRLLSYGIMQILLCMIASAPYTQTPPSNYVHTHLTVDDGLPTNLLRDLVQTPDGYLWIGTQDGLVRYDGNRFDEVWTETPRRRLAYTQARSGPYAFHVQAWSRSGRWSKIPAVLKLVVEPYFYETWWFYVLCGLAALVLLAGIMRLCVRRLVRRKQELKTLVQHRTAALAKELTELHGGRLLVKSTLGLGSTLTVRLPRETLAPSEPQAAAPEASTSLPDPAPVESGGDGLPAMPPRPFSHPAMASLFRTLTPRCPVTAWPPKSTAPPCWSSTTTPTSGATSV